MSETEAPSLSARIERLPWYTVPAILIGVPLLAILLGKLVPAFYDNVIWQYYWGPIKADALRSGTLYHNGVAAEPGYNLVNTLSWAVLMGLCLLGLTQLLTFLKVRMTNAFILGATAWTVTGAVFHVMQDTLLFARPLEFFFITPPIYLMFAAGGIIATVVGWYMKQIEEDAGLERALQKLWLVQVIGVLSYTLLWAAEWDQIVRYISPLHVALFAALNHLLVRWWVLKSGRVAPGEITLMLALTPFLMGLDYVALFIDDPWSPSRAGLPSAALLAPLLAAGAAFLVWAIAKLRHNKTHGEASAAFLQPINLVLIFSQMVDGFATSIGLDLAGYNEKHVLSAFVIDSFRDFAVNIGWEFGATHPTFLAFAPLKLLVSVLVVYAIDVYSKEDVENHPTFIGFVKFAIIMVGIGPGVRDFVRLALGV